MLWRDPAARQGKYEKWYDCLIEKARKRGRLDGPGEWHHSIPESLGGDNSSLVHLTYREHFVAHLLLTKISKPGAARNKMLCALGYMAARDGLNRLNSWEYEIAARARAEAAGIISRQAWEGNEQRRAETAARFRVNNPMRQPDVIAERSGANHHFYGTKRPEMTGESNPSNRPDIRLRLSKQKRGDKNPAKRKDVRDRISATLKQFNEQNPEIVKANPRFRGGKHESGTRKAMSEARKGSLNAFSKLTDDIVREIRRLEGQMKRPQIAALFGINVWHVRDIQKRRCWKHVE